MLAFKEPLRRVSFLFILELNDLQMFQKKLLRKNHGIERSETRDRNPNEIYEVRSDAGTWECVFPCVSKFSIGFVSVVGNKWRVVDSSGDIIAKSSSSR